MLKNIEILRQTANILERVLFECTLFCGVFVFLELLVFEHFSLSRDRGIISYTLFVIS